MQALKISIALTTCLLVACESPDVRDDSPPAPSEKPSETAVTTADEVDDMPTDPYADKRRAMVEQQLKGRDITSQRVLDTMRKVPRHQFVPEDFREMAYADRPLPIGHDQTISQPYIVAKMTQTLDPQPTDKVLEVGTGSGYQAAVLSDLVDELYTIEIVCSLADDARSDLKETGYDDNVTVRCGDGYAGWPDEAPFDKIIVTAAPPEVPEALVEQLAPGGRMIVPVGEAQQQLKQIEKGKDGKVATTDLLPVRFVPMVPGPAE